MPARKSRRHRAAVKYKRGQMLWLAGVLTLPVVAVVGFYVGRGAGGQTAQTAAPAGSVPAASGCATAATADSMPCAQPLVAASIVSPTASPTPTPTSRLRVTHTPVAPPSKPAAPSPATSRAQAGGQQGGPADQVLAVINQARAAAGLPAYTISGGLTLSATRHNTAMASGCGLSHQCPGEASLGARETAAGVTWTSAGENIGEGGPVSSGTTSIGQMAATLTRDMLAEKPPDDGHRLNILSSAFHHIGIAVYRDSSGTVWMTQDFSN
jgi:uncharacterized protein YkwD